MSYDVPSTHRHLLGLIHNMLCRVANSLTSRRQIQFIFYAMRRNATHVANHLQHNYCEPAFIQGCPVRFHCAHSCMHIDQCVHDIVIMPRCACAEGIR